MWHVENNVLLHNVIWLKLNTISLSTIQYITNSHRPLIVTLVRQLLVHTHKYTHTDLLTTTHSKSIEGSVTAFSRVVPLNYYSDVIINVMASQITGVSIVYSTVCSGVNQIKHQNFASLALMWIHRWPVNSQHKGPVTRKMFPFGDAIMFCDACTENGMNPSRLPHLY